jgi:hypothetical protein
VGEEQGLKTRAVLVARPSATCTTVSWRGKWQQPSRRPLLSTPLQVRGLHHQWAGGSSSGACGVRGQGCGEGYQCRAVFLVPVLRLKRMNHIQAEPLCVFCCCPPPPLQATCSV